MQEYFYQLADYLTELLRGSEVYTCSFSAEDSDFVRFNRSAVRQAGTVMQRYLSLSLINGTRHSAGTITVSGDFALDCAHAAQLLTGLREKLPYLPDDPHLLYATEVCSTEHHGKNQLPEESAAIVAAIQFPLGLEPVHSAGNRGHSGDRKNKGDPARGRVRAGPATGE